jgi:hypothetical protein
VPARAAIEDAVRAADSVPPEFAADILIKLAPAAGAFDLAWQRVLLDDAFRRAGSAQQPVRESSAPLPPDTRQIGGSCCRSSSDRAIPCWRCTRKRRARSAAGD